jgi:hypothetical protein
MAIARLQSYLPMIAQQARKAHSKLPSYQRTWIDIEDLIQDGVLFTRGHVMKKFDPKRGVKFTTYLCSALVNYYTNRLHDAYRKKRASGDLLPIEDFHEILFGSDDTSGRVLAEEALQKLLSLASPNLRQYLYQWLVLHAETRNVGSTFRSVKREMRKLSKKVGMDSEDFRLLLSQGDSLRHKVSLFL